MPFSCDPRALAPRGVAALALVIGTVLLVAACSSGRAVRQAPAAVGTTPSARPDAVDGQIRRGTLVYARQCAQCHGAGGAGSETAPALIGAGALPLHPPAGARFRTGTFDTAMQLGMFIKNTMPPGGPATPPEDVAAVMAYVLTANGVRPAQAISPATAGSIPVRR